MHSPSEQCHSIFPIFLQIFDIARQVTWQQVEIVGNKNLVQMFALHGDGRKILIYPILDICYSNQKINTHLFCNLLNTLHGN